MEEIKNHNVLHMPNPTNNLDVHTLKIDGQTIIEPCMHDESYHYQAYNYTSHPNVDIHAGHIDTHGIYTKHATAGSIKTGCLDSGECKINGKLLVDKNKNLHVTSVAINNDVTLTTDSNQNLYVNNVDILSNVPPMNINYKNVDDNNFCKNWNLPYMYEYNVVGYVVSKADGGKYQTIIDSAGNVYTSDSFGRIWCTPVKLTNNNSPLICLSASDTCQYQMCIDLNGFVYLSNDYGSTWRSNLLGSSIYYNLKIDGVDNICCSISNSGRFQIVCYGIEQYASDDYGSSFVNISTGANIEFKFISVKDLGDYYYNLTPGLSLPDNSPQDAIAISISNNAEIFISSYDHSGNWTTTDTINNRKFKSIGNETVDSSGQTLSAFAISDDLMYNTLGTNRGYIFRSDTSGGLINNDSYRTHEGLYTWNSQIKGDVATGGNIMSVGMDSSGSFQIFTTDTGYTYIGTEIEPNMGNSWTIQKVSERPLKFANVVNNGSQIYIYMIDEAGVIFFSATSGTSWKSLTNNMVLKSITCSKSGQYIHVLDASGYICTSSTYGKVWGVPSRNAQASHIGSNFRNGAFHQIVTSDDGQYCYTIDDFKIYRSLDYGRSWTRFSTSTFEAVDSSGSAPIYPLRSISVSGDGNTLAVIDSNYMNADTLTNSIVFYLFDSIKQVNVQTPQKIIIDTDDYITQPTNISLSYDGSYISVVSPTRTYISSDKGSTWKVYHSTESTAQIPKTVISSDGKVISSIMAGAKEINMLNFNGSIRSYQVDSDLVDGLFTGLALSGNGQCVLACDESGNIFNSNNTNVFVREGSTILNTFRLCDTMLMGVAMSEDGKYQFAIDADNHFYVSDFYGKYGTFYSTRENSPSRTTFMNTLATCSDISESGQVITIADSFGNKTTSLDYGKTFSVASKIAGGYSILDIKLNATGKIQYAIGDDGVSNRMLFVSADFGESWNLSYLTHVELRYLSISHDGKYVTLGGRNGDVYTSKDYGITFKQKYVIGHEVNVDAFVKISGCGKYQYVMFPTAIYRSRDYGESWKSIFAPIAPSISPMVPFITRSFTYFSISKSGQYQTYVTEGGQIFISNNFGDTIRYSTILSNDGQDTTKTPCVTMSGNGKYQSVIISNVSGSVSQTCSLSLFVSTDYGSSWKEVNIFPLSFTVPDAITFGLSPKFVLSSNAQYGIFININQVMMTHVGEFTENITRNNIVINNNAMINNLSTCGFTNKGSYIANVTKVTNDSSGTLMYTQNPNDYIIMTIPTTHNININLRNDAPLGQIIIVVSKGPNSTNVYPPVEFSIGTLGIDTPIELSGEPSSLTVMSTGDGNWLQMSSYGIVA
jgi:photosystem II stability/assembly factor-like uncharacterized protein